MSGSTRSRAAVRRVAGVGALAAALLAAGSVVAAELEPAPRDVEARQVAEHAADIMRGATTYTRAVMTIESPRLPTPRVVAFRSWDDADAARSFIRILRPAKDAGMGFLKLDRNLWNYIPRVERTVRIPPSMMQQSWMGSDFTNDDLMRESSPVDDYDHTILGVDPSSEGPPSFVLEYVPHEETPVVWGRIVAWIDVEAYTPRRQDFYDEEGERLRVLRFRDVRDVGGRPVPHHWIAESLDRPGHRTTVVVEEIEFDEAVDDRIFSKTHLRRRDR